jgi:hypothetical protein
MTVSKIKPLRTSVEPLYMKDSNRLGPRVKLNASTDYLAIKNMLMNISDCIFSL